MLRKIVMLMLVLGLFAALPNGREYVHDPHDEESLLHTAIESYDVLGVINGEL